MTQDTATTIPARWTGLPRWRRLPDISVAILLVLAALLIILVGLPLLRLLGLTILGPEGLTLEPLIGAFGRLRHLEALWRSVFIGGSVAIITTMVGVPIAWLVSRSNMPGRNFVTLIVVATFVMPPYLGAVAWMLLGGPNAGWINRAWEFLGGEARLLNIYSMEGMIFLISLYSLPINFIFARSALDVVSSELEDAASILGASRFTTTMKITLPMIWPAILGGAIIVFLESITLFGTPALLGIPAGITVATTQLWQFFEFPPRLDVAAAYSMALIAITVLLLWMQRWFLRRKAFTAMTGKGGERRPVDLGHWRWPVFALCMLVGAMSVFLPLIVLLQAAFAKAWSRGFSLGNLTLNNFDYLLFRNSSAVNSIWNTVWFSAAAASAAVLIALIIAYAQARRLLPGTSFLQFLCMVPIAIPGIVLAVAFYATFAPPPFALYGTAAMLILAFMIRSLPVAFINAAATVKSLNPEMEDAVRILGGSRSVVMRKVVVPLTKGGLIGSWLLVFIASTRELSTAIFLTGPKTKVMSIVMLDLSEEGNFEVLSALGVLLLAAAWIVVWIGQRVAGRDFMLRRP
jgi:iron(III) transport system permease protein